MRQRTIAQLLGTGERFSQDQVEKARLVARPEVAETVREAIRDAGSLYAWAAAHSHAEQLSGRDTLYVIPGPGQERWVVRRLTHGGLLAPLTGDRFLRVGLPRPFNEVRIAQRLHEAGVPTPEVVAAVVYPRGPFYRGEVARREIGDATDLAACLFDENTADEARRAAAMEAAGELVGSIHRVGLIHPDLNLRNVLIHWSSPRPTGYILDLEKCRFGRVGPLRRRRMLGRLRRSARRFTERTGRGVRAEEWDAFWRAYSSAEHLV